jgi:hypothetical protein
MIYLSYSFHLYVGKNNTPLRVEFHQIFMKEPHIRGILAISDVPAWLGPKAPALAWLAQDLGRAKAVTHSLALAWPGPGHGFWRLESFWTGSKSGCCSRPLRTVGSIPRVFNHGTHSCPVLQQLHALEAPAAQ